MDEVLWQGVDLVNYGYGQEDPSIFQDWGGSQLGYVMGGVAINYC